MMQYLRLTAVIIFGVVWLHGSLYAQDGRRRHESPLVRDSESESGGPRNSSVEESREGDKARLTAVKYLSHDDRVRVLLEVSEPVRYEVGRLPEDSSKHLPARIYVDIKGAELALESQEPIHVEDDLLKQIRVGQFNQNTVRVVLDMNSPREHEAFLLPDPFRVVLDLQREKVALPQPTLVKTRTSLAAPKTSKPKVTGIRKIVLDPGHGGKDPGAIGVGGIAEKDIVLSVSKKLAARLRKNMGIEVVLTRTDDRFIPLEDRTAIANAENADLFISLHMNASPNGEARGVETYYLDNTTDEASIRLAARENSTSRKNVSDLQFILSDMTQNMKLEDSVTLAHRLQGSMVAKMGRQAGSIKDLGVKKALFYVLVGARMPSVLLEMFFITNRHEGRAMSRHKFQEAVADALYDGIREYNHSMLAAKTL
ncbi:MAG: N-acetylmuramoyl-L-alanine amidase [Deltaproteobacteria bacterium]|nr:N-acetylmuramoyl-L-alanine amidase [Deltaproteobacteria bacterium]